MDSQRISTGIAGLDGLLHGGYVARTHLSLDRRHGHGKNHRLFTVSFERAQTRREGGLRDRRRTPCAKSSNRRHPSPGIFNRIFKKKVWSFWMLRPILAAVAAARRERHRSAKNRRRPRQLRKATERHPADRRSDHAAHPADRRHQPEPGSSPLIDSIDSIATQYDQPAYRPPAERSLAKHRRHRAISRLRSLSAQDQRDQRQVPAHMAIKKMRGTPVEPADYPFMLRTGDGIVLADRRLDLVPAPALAKHRCSNIFSSRKHRF